MEVTRQRRLKAPKLSGDRDKSRFTHNLLFYTLPPKDVISLQEFEDYAVERLKLLKAVENAGAKHLKGSDEYNNSVRDELKKFINHSSKPKNGSIYDMSDKEYDDIRKDLISHFVLRLAYCKSDELRRWYIQQETDLFRYRFSVESKESIQMFLKENKLNYSPIPFEEKQGILKKLADSHKDMTISLAEATDFYRVPFTEALDLVKARKVYVHRGYVYVPYNELVSIILGVFRTHLSHALAVICRALPHMEEQDRLLPMLSGLSKRYLGQDYSNRKPTGGQVTAAMIDMLSKKSFPLCMLQLHDGLRRDHHLRHWGRMQYGLFLKAIGLSLEEALKFWKDEFTKGPIDPDKFDKQYAYNIRHNYGKEGKRADYTPYNCLKIITSNAPGPGDGHGCPFRHSDTDMLRQKLSNLKIGKENSEAVISKVKEGHYQIACKMVFNLTHGIQEEEASFALQHPNQYFEESQRLINGGKEDGKSSQGSFTPVTPHSTPRTSQNSQKSSQPIPMKMEDVNDEDILQALENAQN
ncbi:DNA primase large subunit [Lingula anatina]|uniref:DNA primase large subunit n=1 Tax=Lingula anatina TaxID=7574 RepID=A0A1S3I8V9_LINAN|nr:DNA primase large subunit [Lingula anatina]|eukprot:XP_013394623.1 DNA primase large subunit [Lingula anatina]